MTAVQCILVIDEALGSLNCFPACMQFLSRGLDQSSPLKNSEQESCQMTDKDREGSTE